MRVPLFQIDAFTGELFSGNPAAVCPLEEWLEDGKLQAIAAENNLSETAFFVGESGRYELRWFTPTTEVDLCGHATLASAFVIWNHLGDSSVQLSFQTRGGLLLAERQDDLVSMSFPSQVPQPCQIPSQLAKALGRVPGEVWFAGESARSGNYLAVYGTEEEVRSLKPDLQLLGQFEGVGFITTAPGESADFVPAMARASEPVASSVTVQYFRRARKARRRSYPSVLKEMRSLLFVSLRYSTTQTASLKVERAAVELYQEVHDVDLKAAKEAVDELGRQLKVSGTLR